MMSTDRSVAVVLLMAVGLLAASSDLAAAELAMSDKLSPLSDKRPLRPETRYIVLHTTEGSTMGALAKLQRYGEAHYLVAASGEVYRTVDQRKIATHAGRSMWEGRSPMDHYSIGIEVAGYHDRDISDAQYAALRELLRRLKNRYRIEDRDVLAHCMVAYGLPNAFYPREHRGRKRCGMLFNRPEVRRRLGLTAGPTRDPDVTAGRLDVADPELYAFLYQTGAPALASLPPAQPRPDAPASSESMVIAGGVNAWRIARERYDKPTTIYTFPDGKTLRGNEIKAWNAIPAGTRVSYLKDVQEPEQEFEGFREIGRDGDTVRDLAGDLYAADTTIYFFPSGLIRTGAELQRDPRLRRLLGSPPKGTRVLVGYIYGGHVRGRQAASLLAGKKWNYPSTYYQLPDGRILSGDEIGGREIPARTRIFFSAVSGERVVTNQAPRAL